MKQEYITIIVCVAILLGFLLLFWLVDRYANKEKSEVKEKVQKPIPEKAVKLTAEIAEAEKAEWQQSQEEQKTEMPEEINIYKNAVPRNVDAIERSQASLRGHIRDYHKQKWQTHQILSPDDYEDDFMYDQTLISHADIRKLVALDGALSRKSQNNDDN